MKARSLVGVVRSQYKEQNAGEQTQGITQSVGHVLLKSGLCGRARRRITLLILLSGRRRVALLWLLISRLWRLLIPRLLLIPLLWTRLLILLTRLRCVPLRCIALGSLLLGFRVTARRG